MDKLYFKLDSQALNSADLCDERYRLDMMEHWRPKKKARALERGSLVHDMLKTYRRAKMEGFTKEEHHAVIQRCIIEADKKFAEMTTLTLEEYKEEDIPTFKENVLHHQYDGWQIIDVERPFSRVLYEDDIPLTFLGEFYAGLVIIYEGIIDALIIDPRIGQAVVDTKTEGRKSNPYILSNQFQGYEWAFGVPVIIDKVGFQKTLPPKEKFRRLVHNSEAHAVNEWVQDTIETVRKILTWYERIARGERLKKNRTSCDKYSGCIYQDVCKIPSELRTARLIARFDKTEPWDPYNRDKEEEPES